MLTMLLVIFLFLGPFLTAVFTGGEILTPTLSLFMTLGFWVCQEIACELEDPFGVEANHLPLGLVHKTVLENLLDISLTVLPELADSYLDPDCYFGNDIPADVSDVDVTWGDNSDTECNSLTLRNDGVS